MAGYITDNNVLGSIILQFIHVLWSYPVYEFNNRFKEFLKYSIYVALCSEANIPCIFMIMNKFNNIYNIYQNEREMTPVQRLLHAIKKKYGELGIGTKFWNF